MNITDLYNEQVYFYSNCRYQYGRGPDWLLTTVIEKGFAGLSFKETGYLEELFKMALLHGASNLNSFASSFIKHTWGMKKIPEWVIFNNKELIFRDSASPLKVEVGRLVTDGLNSEDRRSLFKFALENGGKIYKGYLKPNLGLYHTECIELPKNPELHVGFELASPQTCSNLMKDIDLFKKYGARCDDYDIKYNFLKHYGLKHFTCNPKEMATLWGVPSNLQKDAIPHTLHQIWLSNPNEPKDIKDNYVEEIKANHLKLALTKHVIWTNIPEDKLPPNLLKLVMEGIVIIKHPHEALFMPEEVAVVDSLFFSKKIGMAVDLLRYVILCKFGGIYADLNFEFKSDLATELSSQDFIGVVLSSGYIENFFMATKPEHPILKNAIQLVLNTIKNPPSYFNLIEAEKTLTDHTTFYPLSIAYYKHSNQNTADLVCPYFASYEKPQEPVKRDGLNDFELLICPGYDDPELAEISQCIPDYYYDMSILIREHYFALVNQGINCTVGSDSRELTWMQQA